jgi:hypothetical protein
MARTIADMLREEGRNIGLKKGLEKGQLKALRRTLLTQLRQKFGELPAETERAVRATRSVKDLEHWLIRILSARSLREMNIGPAP